MVPAGSVPGSFPGSPPAAQVSEVKADALEIPTLFSELS